MSGAPALPPIVSLPVGLRAPSVALGTATFGLQCSEDESHAMLNRAEELGLVWLDTATSYPVGSGPESVGISEEIIGRWIGGRRANYLIGTKVYNRTGPSPWQLGLSRKHVFAAVEGSLARLGTDYLDFLQLHRFDASVPLEETLSAVDRLVSDGKVRYFGVCNFAGFQITAASMTGLSNGWPTPATAQVRFNLLMRGAESELFAACRASGVAVLAFNMLAGGLLTGKHRRDAPEEGGRFTLGAAGERYRQRYWDSQNFDTIDSLKAFAAEVGVPLTTLAIAWVAQHPGVTAPIAGASRLDHLDALTEALQYQMPADVRRRLDELTVGHRRLVDEVEFESS